jgi:hypothetical protein
MSGDTTNHLPTTEILMKVALNTITLTPKPTIVLI